MFEKNLNISLLLDFYGDILTERQKDMLDFYYNDDLSLAEIADNYDISRQGVRSVLKKGENILINMEEKLHLAERFSSVQEKSSKIASELEEISRHINNEEISAKIIALIEQIKELAD
ncbi:MAG: DNA-binding protein [Clostridia bacterium]|nr:DNA-binding protein [Clostridia bacterium]